MNSTNELSFPAPAHWINGRPVPVDGPTIDVVNPATGPADAVQYLTTPLSAYVTGQVLAVDGGSTMH